ncbi:MAG TPA: hypothetical protein VGM01_03495 [Ktedonobacteraceae bacterium]|jgi:hypothetical protein
MESVLYAATIRETQAPIVVEREEDVKRDFFRFQRFASDSHLQSTYNKEQSMTGPATSN